MWYRAYEYVSTGATQAPAPPQTPGPPTPPPAQSQGPPPLPAQLQPRETQLPTTVVVGDKPVDIDEPATPPPAPTPSDQAMIEPAP
jgi:hypothetical protein